MRLEGVLTGDWIRVYYSEAVYKLRGGNRPKEHQAIEIEPLTGYTVGEK
jgi:hypothetical protein